MICINMEGGPMHNENNAINDFQEDKSHGGINLIPAVINKELESHVRRLLARHKKEVACYV